MRFAPLNHVITFYAWFTLARKTENGIKQSAIFRRGKSWNKNVRIPETPPPHLSANLLTPPPPLSAGVFYEQPLKLWNFAWGTLLQPWPNAFGMRKYFSGNYVFPSPKTSEDQKKKKRSSPQFRTKFGRICGISSCWQALFRLINQRSNLDGGRAPPPIKVLIVRLIIKINNCNLEKI